MLGDRDDAHDCLRETFLAAFRHLPTFTWQEGGLYPWLKTLAKNKARDLLRASGRRQRLRGAFEEHLGTAGSDEPKNPAEEELQRGALRVRIEACSTASTPATPRCCACACSRTAAARSAPRPSRSRSGTLDVLLFRACKSFRAACDKLGLVVATEL
jgi:hypothetical protein